jgi:hypothetical protein
MARNEINKRRMVIKGDDFRLLGVMGCKPCTVKWKQSLQGNDRKVRIVKVKKGYEVWATWQK